MAKKVKKKSTKKVLRKKALKKNTAKKATKKKTSKKKTKKSTSTKHTSKTLLKVSPVNLTEGDSAPDFQGLNESGKTIRLSDFANTKLVLYFYPKDLTPGCTVQACDFRDSLNSLKSMGVAVVGVSMDDQNLHNRFIQKHNLNFPLISDTDGKICYDYGVLKEKNMYGKKFVGIMRKTFIIENKKIIKAYPHVKAEGHVQKIISDLQLL